MSLSKLRIKFLVGFVSSALVAAPLLLVAGTASADTSTWSSTQSTTVDLSSYDAFGNDGELNGIACFTDTSCVSAGEAYNGDESVGSPMQLTGDAKTWGVGGGGNTAGDDINFDNAVSDPNPGSSLSFFDVHNADTSNDGIVGAAIQSISCPNSAASCVSVGYDSNHEPYLLLGDPTTWNIDHAYDLSGDLPTTVTNEGTQPDYGALNSVSCVLDPTEDSGVWCAAVGYDDTTEQSIVISGDPSTWADSSTSQFTELYLGTSSGNYSVLGNLNGVSCVSSTECVAVGKAQAYTYVSSIRRVHTRASLRHSSVSEVTNLADGNYYLSYNGDPTAWADGDPSLTPISSGYSGALNGVSCTSSSFCEAVGYSDSDSDITSQPVLFTGDPTNWGTTYDYATYTLSDSLGAGGGLNGVSCPTSSYCAAVGFDGNSEDGEEPIVLSGDPSTWAGDAWNSDAGTGNDYVTELDPTPQYQGDYTLGYFNAVSCTAAYTCVAVGHFDEYGDPGPFTAWIAAPAATPTYSAPAPVLYPVTYLPGGASGTPPTQASLNAGATFTVASPSSLTYTGETFTGWSDGTTVYQPGSTYTMPAAPVTLTAQWTPTATPANNTPPSKALLRTEVLFPFNKYYLTAQAKRQLDSFAKKIEASNVTNFTVVGSTDLFGSEGYNIPLSEHRAHAVSAYLTARLASLGVNDVVFHDTWIGILKTQPTYTQNRRTVVAD